jgi:hypothetical protein
MTEPAVGSRHSPFRLKGRGGVLGAAIATVGIAGVLVALATSGPSAVAVTLPAGTKLVAILQHTVSTEHARPGDAVQFTTRDSIAAAEGATLPPGLALVGEVTHAKGGGRVAGRPELTIRVTRIAVEGEDYQVSAAPFRFRGADDATESALEIAGGAVAGALLGKVVGGDALKGAVIGAAAGTAVAVATKGNQIVLPAGTRLRVELTEPLTVSYRRVRSSPGR